MQKWTENKEKQRVIWTLEVNGRKRQLYHKRRINYKGSKGGRTG